MVIQASERLLKANSALSEALAKAALVSTSSSGQALHPEDLEPALVEELLRIQPLFAMIPVKRATSRVHEIARRTAHGSANYEGELVDGRSTASSGTYDRPTVTLKVLRYWGAVSGFQQAASAKFQNSLLLEQQGGLESVANQFEFGVLWGDKGAVGEEFDGFESLVTTNRVQHNAKVTLALLDSMIVSTTSYRGVRQSDPLLWLMSSNMRAVVDGLQGLARIPVNDIDFDGKLRMTTYDRIPILESSYLASISPATGDLDSAVKLSGGSLADDQYFYKVAPVYETGEQQAFASEESDTTSASDNAVTLTITADPLAEYYKVYRGSATGDENLRYLGSIDAWVRNSDGAKTTQITAIIDTGAAATAADEISTSFTTVTLHADATGRHDDLLQGQDGSSVGEEFILLLNLNPDRGASVVSLVDAVGQPVQNLISMLQLATTRSSFDFALESFLALQTPWEKLHAIARGVRRNT